MTFTAIKVALSRNMVCFAAIKVNLVARLKANANAMLEKPDGNLAGMAERFALAMPMKGLSNA